MEKTMFEERANERLEALNKVVLENGSAKSEQAAKKLLDDEISAWNKDLRDDDFDKLLADKENAVTLAILQLTVPAKVVKKDAKIGVYSIEDGTARIDLLDFCQYGHFSIGWKNTLDKFKAYMRVQHSQELTENKQGFRDNPDVYVENVNLINKVASAYGVTFDAANPVSNRQLVSMLNDAVKEVLGEGYEAFRKDVFHIKTFSFKQKSALIDTGVNDKTTRRLFMEALHRIASGADYGFEAE